ncbi:MAG: DUF3048 domain-containing protein [Eubacterium sp.]|nr:DUF3048 domain-containing protein [Eubacterium sp.]
MSEREIDQILKELRQHSEKENAAGINSAPAPQSEPAPEVKEEPEEVVNTQPQPEFRSVKQHEPVRKPVVEKAPQEVTPAEPIAEEEEIKIEEPVAEEKPAEAEENTTDLFTLADNADEQPKAPEPKAAEEPAELNEEPYDEEYYDDEPAAPKRNKALVIILSALLLIGVIACAYLGILAYKGGAELQNGKQEITITQTEINPLTGEDTLSNDAAGKRPVAVVAENEFGVDAVKPQWGLSYADIVLEGETEYSTRLLLFFADYSKIPAQVGPVRSARPQFIRFGEFFDSIFIHAGLSHSKGDYEGADEVFDTDRVDHVDLLGYSDDGKYVGRDYSRTTTTEHTAYFNGKNTESLLKEKKIVTDIEEARFTALPFNKKAQPLSEKEAASVTFRWSKNRCQTLVTFRYDADEGLYTTTDFDSRYGESNAKFQNLIFLLDKTEYVVKKDYQGKGNSETYCTYMLEGGKGKILSQGTYVDINWSIENGKLAFKTADGKQVNLNPGKSYIGWGSSNNGGTITIE